MAEEKKDAKVIALEPETTSTGNTEEAPTPELHYDPNEYGYPEGGKAPFEGNLLLWVMNFAQTVAVKETSTVYNTENSFEETRKTGREQITDLGLQALRILELLTQGHLENIDSGQAVHQDVLTGKRDANKPIFEMQEVKSED